MLANLFTAARLLLAFPTALVFASPENFPAWTALLFMSIAIITDVSDGKIARAQGTASAKGMLFDHSTDCLFVVCALAGASWAEQLTPVLPPLVLFAFAQYVIDSRLLHKQKQLRMSSIGRWNGILYFGPPLILALAATLSADVAELLRLLASYFAWVLVISTVVSIVDRAFARS